jgi:hypothetical protein
VVFNKKWTITTLQPQPIQCLRWSKLV